MQRRQAREIILKALYRKEFINREVGKGADDFSGEDLGDQKSFIENIFYGTLEKREEIDELITNFTRGWKVERLAVLDRNILRMAIYELIYYRQTPVEVVINEAIELSKDYGTENAPKFINGILDKLWKKQES
ncbi:MAG: transcription antitermination factor NusB [Candidatus Acetothermia bacterium]|nr:transcription antitermination factor NusB [Candidatus Bipolaricaulota bacterium]